MYWPAQHSEEITYLICPECTQALPTAIHLGRPLNDFVHQSFSTEEAIGHSCIAAAVLGLGSCLLGSRRPCALPWSRLSLQQATVLWQTGYAECHYLRAPDDQMYEYIFRFPVCIRMPPSSRESVQVLAFYSPKTTGNTRTITPFLGLPPFLLLEVLPPLLQSSSLSPPSSWAEAAAFFWPGPIAPEAAVSTHNLSAFCCLTISRRIVSFSRMNLHHQPEQRVPANPEAGCHPAALDAIP